MKGWEASERLAQFCDDWLKWADSANKSEGGWQSDYPKWQELMTAAESTIVQSVHAPEDIRNLELCWSISSETEDLADFAKDNLDQSWPILIDLSHSEDPEVRWQVYSVLRSAGRRGEPMLRQGLADPDSYSRRRAFLSLARLAPPDAKQLATQYVEDTDPYMRLAALDMARVSGDSDFLTSIQVQLQTDENEQVRRAADY